MRVLTDVVAFIAPSIANALKNRKLRLKIQRKEFSYPPKEKSSNYTIENYQELYKDEIYRKDKLEEKAKTNVLGVSISVTLIMGASSVINSLSDKYGNSILFWTGFGLFVLAVFYVLFAGVHSIHLLVAENVVYKYSIDLAGVEEKNDLVEQIGLNNLRNLVRNNYIYTSYECIRNALLCLAVVMIIAILPISFIFDKETTNEVSCRGEFYYSQNAIDTICNGVKIEKIEEYISKNMKDGSYSVIDIDDGVYIKYYIEKGKVSIQLLERLSDGEDE